MMTPRQSAIVLTLLAALYGGTLVLFAPELDFFGRDTDFLWFPGAVAGLAVAAPAFLALWAVLGRQRTTVRVPLTAWLCSMYFLAVAYGEVRNFGAGQPDIVMLVLVVWVTAYIADLLLLRLLRALRGWRLERIDDEPRTVASGDESQPRRQFTIRTPLVWTAAAAALFAGLRWLTPYGVFVDDGLVVGLFEGVLFEGALMGLIIAPAGLPVVSVALIILTNGRRTIWRCVLALLTALGIAGGVSATPLVFGDGHEIVVLALAIEMGVLAAGIAAAALTRTCGYRLVRNASACDDLTLTRSVSEGKPDAPSFTLRVSAVDSSRRNRRFAFALAPLVITALLLACYSPRRWETWRRADESQRWQSLGWHAEFDDDGHIADLMLVGECDIDGTITLVGQLSHLKLLQLDETQSFALLPELRPLPELKTMIMGEASDAVLSHLERFPNLESLVVSGKEVTDAGLSHLTTLAKLNDVCLAETGVLLEEVPPLPQLKSLDLRDTALGDAGLSHLDRFPNLLALDLSGTNVTDGGLAGLRALKSLTTLTLRVTDIGDESLPVLAGLSQLRSLDLQLTAVSEAGFRELCSSLPDAAITVGANDDMLERTIFSVYASVSGVGQMVMTRGGQRAMLKHLHARGKHLTEPPAEIIAAEKRDTVTDDGLALLTGQTTMDELDLRDSAVTDAGLKSLAKLTNLKRLDLRGTHVTEPGCQRLAKTLPGCQIVR